MHSTLPFPSFYLSCEHPLISMHMKEPLEIRCKNQQFTEERNDSKSKIANI